MSKKIQLPLNIYIKRNLQFFVKIEWFLYEKLNKKRRIPCGRTKRDKYLCCHQPLDEKHCYYNEDRTRIYCKCCDKLKTMSNYPINLKTLWSDS